MNRTKTTTYNAAVSAIIMAVTYIAQFAYRTVLMKVMGENYAGINGLFGNIISIFGLAEMGIGVAITLCLYKPLAENDEKHIAILMHFFKKIYTYIGIFVSVAGVCLLPFLNHLVTTDSPVKHMHLIYLILLFNTVCSYLFFAYYQTLLTAARMDFKATVPKTAIPILVSIAQITVILLFKNYVLVVLVSVFGTLAKNIWIAYITRKMYPYVENYKDEQIDKDEKSWIWNYVKATFLYKISMQVLYSTDSIVISKMINLAALGFYSNYQLITETIKNIMMMIVQPINGAIGDLNVTTDTEYKRIMLRRLNFFNNWLCLFCTICLFILMDPFVTVLFGARFVLNKATVTMICINFYTELMPNFVTGYRGACGLNIYGRFRPLFTAVINLGVSIWLAPHWGLFGVLFGTLISRLTTIFWYDPYIVYKKVFNDNCSEYFISYAKNTVLMILIGLPTYWIFNLIWQGGWLTFFIGAIITAIIPNLVMFLIYRKTDYFKYYLDYFKKLIARKL